MHPWYLQHKYCPPLNVIQMLFWSLCKNNMATVILIYICCDIQAVNYKLVKKSNAQSTFCTNYCQYLKNFTKKHPKKYKNWGFFIKKYEFFYLEFYLFLKEWVFTFLRRTSTLKYMLWVWMICFSWADKSLSEVEMFHFFAQLSWKDRTLCIKLWIKNKHHSYAKQGTRIAH